MTDTNGLRSDFHNFKQREWHEFLQLFMVPSDKDLLDAVNRLPISDLEAINDKYMNGSILAEFVKLMKITLSYEILIQKCYARIVKELDTAYSFGAVNLLPDSVKEIKYCVYCANRYSQLLKEDRDRIRERKDIEIKRIPFVEYSVTSPMPVAMSSLPRLQALFFEPINQDSIKLAIAEMQAKIKQSENRVNTFRRRKFREYMIRNHDSIYSGFLTQIEKSFRLHQTKIDRMVIDVYDEGMYSYLIDVHQAIENCHPTIIKNLNRNRVPTQSFINILKELEGSDESIDSIAAGFDRQCKLAGQEGNAYNGMVTSTDLDTGIKCIFNYKPGKKGAPIRLRVIVNLQTLIQKDMFREHPEKEKYYKEHTWLDGSETNFLMPEDYEYYLQNEQSWCTWLEEYARSKYIELAREHLRVCLFKKNELIVYISQWEVCHEIPFRSEPVRNPTVKNEFKHPSLHDYFLKLYSKFHRFAGKYINMKYEVESARPSVYMDLPSMDPTLAMMQYKIYPKFRNSKNEIMIRHEITPTRYMKIACADATDKIPIAFKVLTNPAWCRETMERYLQLELWQNGMNGLGYNERYHEWKNPEPEIVQLNLVKAAIFGSLDKAAKYESPFQAFLDTGILPGTIPHNYRKKMVDQSIVTKKKRGEYRITESFSRLLDSHT